MYILKGVSTIVFFMFIHFSSYCQRGVKIGEQCPDVELNNIINYKTTHSRISDFKGRLLILEFWATWCSPCINAFQKLDSIQKEFADKIQILPVSYQDPELVGSFIAKMNQLKHLLPPSVTKDSILNRLFKHTTIPHYVWIDKDSRVIAITSEEEVTRDHIEGVLTGRQVVFNMKFDKLRQADFEKNFFGVDERIKEGNVIHMEKIDEDQLLYHSVITNYIDNMVGFGHQDSTSITLINNSICNLYKDILGEFGPEFVYSNSRLILEVIDSGLVTDYSAKNGYLYGASAVEWFRRNGFSYELKVPKVWAHKKWEIALEDLNRYFGALCGIEGRMEKRKRKCLVLVRTSKEDKIAAKGDLNDFRADQFYFANHNGKINELVIGLRKYQQSSKYPILDETNYQGKVDMELNCNLSDMAAINAELKKYDLTFLERDGEFDMVVIHQKGWPGLKSKTVPNNGSEVGLVGKTCE